MVSKSTSSNVVAVSVLGLLISLGAGCSGGPALVDVQGKVSWQGQPVGKGEITFVPLGKGQPAVGVLQPDGTFQLRSHGGYGGVEAGEYRIAIRSYEGSFINNDVTYLVPERFSRIETSNLTASIPDNGDPIVLAGSTEDLMIQLE